MMFFAYLFVLGLIVGSFINVVVYRSVNTESSNRRRSFCPHCGHTLGVFDLVPLFSYMFLKGKCRYCRQSISPRYFVGELTVGLLFLLSGLVAPSLLDLSYYLVVVSVLSGLFFADLYYGILPNNLIIAGLALTVPYLLYWAYLGDTDLLVSSALAASGAFAFFFAFLYFSGGRAMGAGDVKYSFWMGLLVGWPNILVGLFISFLTGALISVTLILVGSKKLGQTIPFGPFLVFGTIIALFWGQEILNWYLGISAR